MAQQSKITDLGGTAPSEPCHRTVWLRTIEVQRFPIQPCPTID
jgi:hypothetical protein